MPAVPPDQNTAPTFSHQRFSLTGEPGVLVHDETNATLGVAFWCGTKQATTLMETLMLDLISMLSTFVMFTMAWFYVIGCDRLKGTRP